MSTRYLWLNVDIIMMHSTTRIQQQFWLLVQELGPGETWYGSWKWL